MREGAGRNEPGTAEEQRRRCPATTHIPITRALCPSSPPSLPARAVRHSSEVGKTCKRLET
jgi:hypothetical protein